jgi:hypothetical protein
LANLFTRIDEDCQARPIRDPIEAFLGDYTDSGPSSRQVIDLVIERRQNHEVMLLMRHHDDCLLRLVDDPDVLSEWRQNGGFTTILSGKTRYRAGRRRFRFLLRQYAPRQRLGAAAT